MTIAVSEQSSLFPSILDRLTKDASSDLIKSKSLCKDLEALLNTRQQKTVLPSDFVETRESLLTYGLPDLALFNPGNEKDRERIESLLKAAIESFEPRLKNVEVTLDPSKRDDDQALGLLVTAHLQTDETGERQIFKFWLTSQSRIKADD